MREIEKLYTGDSGYDFYKTLKKVPADFANGSLKINQITSLMANITRSVERDHNTKMALAFCNWWNSQAKSSAVTRPKPMKYSPANSGFKIRIAPELEYSNQNGMHLVYLWAVAKPSLNKVTAGAGIYLLKEALANTQYFGHSVSILDLRKSKLFDETNLTNQSGTILSADISQFSAIKKSLGL